MSFAEFRAKWRAERERLSRYGARVDPGILLDEVLHDAEAAFAAPADDLLTVEDVAAESGCSTNHLCRLVRQGTIAVLRNDVLMLPNQHEHTSIDARLSHSLHVRSLKSTKYAEMT